MMPDGIGRRGLLAAPLAGLLGAAAEQPFTPTLLVAGPEGGRLATLAAELAPSLARGLPGVTALRRSLAGAADGVTGANQFDVRGDPDGKTALLMPGAALLAWLTGDPRVHFDAGRWVAVIAGLMPGVVAMRRPPQSGATLRIAADSPAGPELPALLALGLLGAQPAPVAVGGGEAAACRALAEGRIDAAMLFGRDAARRAAAIGAGAAALFSLGLPDAGGALARSASAPDLPTFAEYYATQRGAPPAGPLHDAFRATATAAQLDFAVVLPALTPGAMVAVWRRAGDATVAGLDQQTPFLAVATPVASGCIAALTLDAADMLELQHWLATQFNWRPS